MKVIKTEDAVGQILCHDITQIIPGVIKDAKFRKGHIIKAEDIEVLLSLGKEHLYVWELDETKYHENEAAEILYDLCKNEQMSRGEVKEGKIELFAMVDGLLKINRTLLDGINHLGEMMIAARHGNTPVKVGDKICGTRIIPLMIEKTKMQEAIDFCNGTPIFSLLPFEQKKVGIVTTGGEVFRGRIKDAFGPVLKEKVAEYQCSVLGQTICDDQPDRITEAILAFIQDGAELVLCSGGMSVDPDDRTPLAIKNTGAEIISYGAPVLPGAMFLLAYYEKDGKKIPIVGLPGCVMYAKRTIFDLVLPRLLANDLVEKVELDQLGAGGLCLNCETCTWPNCGFGKGW